MGRYQTEQKKQLIAFLAEHKNQQFSAEELSEMLAAASGNGEKAPGKSTVYRLVSSLAEEGVLRRFPKSGGRGWLYQFHQMTGCTGALHLKCSKCGMLLHLTKEESDSLLRQIRTLRGFTVNSDASVLYGLCETCESRALPVYTEERKRAPCPRHRKLQNPLNRQNNKKEKML